MFKTFSSKFFAIYALTTFVIFLLLFGVFTQILTDYFVSGKYRTMQKECATISTQYKETYIDRTLTESAFQYQTKTTSYFTGSRILIVNNTDMVVFDSDSSAENIAGSVIRHEFIDKALGGETINVIGDFKPFENDPVIAVAYPIEKDAISEAAIVMFSPYPSVKEDITYIYNLTLICLLVIMFVTFMSTFVFSRSISQTFKSFNQTAKRIAGGDFSSRIEPNAFSTETIELADSLNYMAEELEKLEDLRKDFIANISHDFRSPLTSIRGYAQAIMDGTIPPERQDKYLNVILNESDRLTKLTNDILLLTKMENEVLKPEHEDFDLHETIRKILMQFEQKIVDKGINLTLLIEQQDIIVNADYNQVNRIITNLLDNAIKFCSSGDEITVETSLKADKVVISVKDSGPGISEDDMKHIWTRFHKADRSRGKDKKGVGLGLSIVREIIKAHGETIDVYSQLGKGSTFVFTLSVSNRHLETE